MPGHLVFPLLHTVEIKRNEMCKTETKIQKGLKEYQKGPSHPMEVHTAKLPNFSRRQIASVRI